MIVLEIVLFAVAASNIALAWTFHGALRKALDRKDVTIMRSERRK
jgi:hypothetical protein